MSWLHLGGVKQLVDIEISISTADDSNEAGSIQVSFLPGRVSTVYACCLQSTLGLKLAFDSYSYPQTGCHDRFDEADTHEHATPGS